MQLVWSFFLAALLVASGGQAEEHDKLDHEKGFTRYVQDRTASIVAAVDKLDRFTGTKANGEADGSEASGRSNLAFETKAKAGKGTIGFQVMTASYYDESPIFWFNGKKEGVLVGADGFKKIEPASGETARDVQLRLTREGGTVGTPDEKSEVVKLEKDLAVFRGEWRDSKYHWLSYTVLRRDGNKVRKQRFVFRDAHPTQAEAILKAIQPLFDVSRDVILANK